ncbi:MAG: recombinase family protein [Hyphomicrobiales bacterium]
MTKSRTPRPGRNPWPFIDTTGRRIGYARVSTKDQKLRMQLDALQAVDCEKIFKDHGVSGAKAKRPGLDVMLTELQPGDTVIVFKLDRLGRSVLHLSDLLVRFRDQDISFVSIAEGINTTTPGGKLVYHLFSAFAEFQRDIIVENTQAGLEAAKKRGAQLGRPRKLRLEEVMHAWEMIIEGQTPAARMARQLNVSPATLNRAIQRLQAVVPA